MFRLVRLNSRAYSAITNSRPSVVCVRKLLGLQVFLYPLVNSWLAPDELSLMALYANEPKSGLVVVLLQLLSCGRS